MVCSESIDVRGEIRKIESTDSDGLTFHNLSKDGMNLFKNKKNLICVENGDDVSFLVGAVNNHYDENQKPRLLAFVFDDTKMYKPKDVAKVKGILRFLIFDDRVGCSSGKQRKLGLVKEGVVIKYKVLDSMKVEYVSKEVVVDDCSSFYLEIPVPDNVNLGEHWIEFDMTEEGMKEHHQFPDQEVVLGTQFKHNFKVEEFETPEFVTSCKTEGKSYLMNDKAVVTASATYYSGSGLYNCKVRWDVNQVLHDDFKPGNGKYNNYIFKLDNRFRSRKVSPGYTNYNEQPKASYLFQDSSCLTNSSGEHSMMIELHNPQKWMKMNHYSLNQKRNFLIEEGKLRASRITIWPKNESCDLFEKDIILPRLHDKVNDVFSTLKVTCNAKITDITQNVLECKTDFKIHPCKLYVGILNEKNSVQLREEAAIKIIVLDSIQETVVAGIPVCIELFKGEVKIRETIFIKSQLKPVEVRVMMFEEWGSGNYTFVCTVFDDKGFQNCASSTFYCNRNPKNFTGVARVDDLDNRMKSFRFDDPINYPEEALREKILKVIFDKNEYFVGDVAQVIIRSPIVGQGYLNVYSHAIVFKHKFAILDPKIEHTIQLKIGEEFVPNCKVSCIVTGKAPRKDVNDFEIEQEECSAIVEMPAYAKGQGFFRASPKHFEIGVDVKANEEIYSPSEEGHCVVQAGKTGKSVVTLLIVDASVLALSGYKLEFPVEHFYPQNLIRTFESFLRKDVFVRKWKANLKKIEEEKQKIERTRRERIERAKLEKINRERELEAMITRVEMNKKMMEEEAKRRRLYELKKKMLLPEREGLERREAERKKREEMRRRLMEMKMKKQMERKMMMEEERKRKCEYEEKRRYREEEERCRKVEESFDYCEDAEDDEESESEEEEEEEEEERGLGLFGGESESDSCSSSDSDDDADMTSMRKKGGDDALDSILGFASQKDSVEEEESSEPIAMRKLFESTVIFANCVRTDESGKAVVPFKLPDNLTEYRIWCLVEQESGYFGFGENSMVAKLPFSVRAVTPPYLNYGDKVELKFVLGNQSEEALRLKCALRATEGLLAYGEVGYGVDLPKGLRGEVSFPVQALKVGEARYQVAASAGKFNDAVEKPIDVHSPSLVSNFVSYGELDDDSCHIQQVIPPEESEVFRGFGGLEVQASSTIFQQLTDAFLYVYGYKYDCVEQSTSRVMSIYSMVDIVEQFELKDIDKKEEILKVMEASMVKLCESQKDNGGFGFWTRDSTLNVYLSTHAAHAMIRVRSKWPSLFDDVGGQGGSATAQSKKFTQMLEKSKQFLYSMTQYVPVGYRREANCSVRAFCLYVLSMYNREGLVDEKGLKTLVKRVNQLYNEVMSNPNQQTNETKAWLAYALSNLLRKSKVDKSDADSAEVKEEEIAMESIEEDDQKKIDSVISSLFHCLHEENETAFFNPTVTYENRCSKLEMLGSSLRENGVILEVLCELTPSEPVVAKLAKHLMKLKKYGKWGNTNENQAILLGLTTYFNIFEKAVPDFKCNFWVEEEYIGEVGFKGRETDIKTFEIPMDKLAITEKEKIEISEKRKILEKKADVARNMVKKQMEDMSKEYEEKFGELFSLMRKKYELDMSQIKEEHLFEMKGIEKDLVKKGEKKKEEEEENEMLKKKKMRRGFRLFEMAASEPGEKEVDEDDIAFFTSQIGKRKEASGGKKLVTADSEDMKLFAKKIAKNRRLVEFDETHEDEEEKILNQIKNKKVYIVKQGQGRLYYRLKFRYAPRDLKIFAFDFGFNVVRSYHPIEKEEEVRKDLKTSSYSIHYGALVRVRVQFTTKSRRFHVALCDHVPAGLEVLNPNLKTTIAIPSDPEGKYNRKWYDHVNYRLDRVEVFKGETGQGTYYFSYVCRAKHIGAFVSIPATCEEMYNEEINGQSNTDFVAIRKVVDEDDEYETDTDEEEEEIEGED